MSAYGQVPQISSRDSVLSLAVTRGRDLQCSLLSPPISPSLLDPSHHDLWRAFDPGRRLWALGYCTESGIAVSRCWTVEPRSSYPLLTRQYLPTWLSDHHTSHSYFTMEARQYRTQYLLDWRGFPKLRLYINQYLLIVVIGIRLHSTRSVVFLLQWQKCFENKDIMGSYLDRFMNLSDMKY